MKTMKLTEYGSLPWHGRIYVAGVISAGTAVIVHSIYSIHAHPIDPSWFILAALTILSGSFNIKLPSVPATISVSDTFIFSSILLFGPSAGTITVALDGLVISFWLQRNKPAFHKALFNTAAPALSLWSATHCFSMFAGEGTLAAGRVATPSLLVPLLLLAAVYFLFNSWLTAIAVSLERHRSPLYIWRHDFLWLSLNFFSGASAAFLFVSFGTGITFGAVAVTIPLLLVSYLTYRTTMDRIADADSHVSELSRLHISTIETLAMAVDAKDQITWGHIRRVQIGATRLAEAVGVTHQKLVQAIEAGALLHDLGKLAIPEYILNKPGKLTPSEFDTMKLHASVGADILSAVQFPYPVVPIVRHHHENWDGTGYPAGLAGTEIPIGARILAVADCFDALTSDRPYRPRLSTEAALEELKARRGTMYDPVVVDVLVRVHTDILAAGEDLQQEAFPTSVIGPQIGPSRIAPINCTAIGASSDEMIGLYELGRRLGTARTFREAAHTICSQMFEVIPASLYVIYLKDPSTGSLKAAYVSSLQATDLLGLHIPLGHRVSGWVAAHRRTASNKLASLDLAHATSDIGARFIGCLATPLQLGTDSIGVLTAYAEQADYFTPTHTRLIETAADIICPSLCRLLNGSQDTDTAHKEGLARSDNGHTRLPMSILVVSVGSTEHKWQTSTSRAREHLAYLFDLLRPRMRTSDALFSYTPTELLVLLTATEPSTAAGIATRSLAGLTLPEVTYRIQYGVASAPVDGESLQALVATARHRLRSTFIQNGAAVRALSAHHS